MPIKSFSERAKQWGNKTANLQELMDVCFTQTQTNIPEFCPLSDALVQTHLDQYAPTWRSLWSNFQQEQKDKTAEISPEAQATLHQLRALIILTFNQFPMSDPILADFLSNMSAKNAKKREHK